MSPANAKREPNLTASTFDVLLAKLGPTPALAALRYERLRRRLVLFFLRHGPSSAEDLADEVIDRLARRLAEGEPIAAIEGYALGIARLVAREQANIRAREAAGEYSLRNILGQNNTLSEEAENLEHRIKAMERCVSLLPPREAELLTKYHLTEGRQRITARAQLAEELALSPGALRKQVFRLCSNLRDCVRARLSSAAQHDGERRS